MATIQKRGDKYRVQIRKQGQKPLTQTFTTRKDALAWAKKVESEIERGIFLDTTEAQQTTLSEALDRYGQEVSPSKRGCYKELSRIKRLKADLGNLSLSIISSKFIASYRDTRLQIADSQTVRRELALLSHVLYRFARLMS